MFRASITGGFEDEVLESYTKDAIPAFIDKATPVAFNKGFDEVGDLADEAAGDDWWNPVNWAAEVASGGAHATGSVGGFALDKLPLDKLTDSIGVGGAFVVELLDPDGDEGREQQLSEMIIDPAVKPPDEVQGGLDWLLSIDRSKQDLPGTYYVPILIERGYLPPFPSSVNRSSLPLVGQTYSIEPPEPAGPFREDD